MGGVVQKAFIAIPTHDGNVKAATCASLMHFAGQGSGFEVHFRANDSLLPQARNVLLATFMASDCTDLVFVDADVAWQPGMLSRLLSHPVDFVAGAYRYKREPEEYPMQWLPKPMLIADPDTGLLEVASVPFGFVRLSRSCCERLIEAHKDRTFAVADTPDLKCWCVFDLEYRDGQYHGEDYVFCRRWRELGGKVWLDPLLELTHIGGAQAYPGSIGRWLKAR
jgi:hypothetical protein